MGRFIGRYVAVKSPGKNYIALVKVETVGGDNLKSVGKYKIVYPAPPQDVKLKRWVQHTIRSVLYGEEKFMDKRLTIQSIFELNWSKS